ncbi:response regulator [Christensenellaceae bacterium OttesenSCG-928-K19]|nr:response regulator [Christensenellaceae bacterium OttesenSCG-928-K19]
MDNSRKKIMLVDDNVTNLVIGKNVLSDKYDVFTIPSGEKLFKLLEKTTPDLILLDIEMPEMNGYDVIRRLKEGEGTKHIPVIFLTAKNDTGSELEGLSLGAIDYISKPFSPPLLLKRIDLHLLVEDQKRELKDYNDNLQEMVKEKTKTVVTLQNAVLQTVAELVECRDDITGGHIERTQHYLRILVNALIDKGIYLEEMGEWKDNDFFFQSAQLHDVGKIAIKDSILMKPGKLSENEFEEMKEHTTFGGKVIDKIGKSTEEKAFLAHAKVFAETHHERWDGTGYPLGMSGKEIPLEGRLMAIADVYDALISERPYKEALTHGEAVEIIVAGKGTHFDPVLTDLFLSVADSFDEVTKFAQTAGHSPADTMKLERILNPGRTAGEKKAE